MIDIKKGQKVSIKGKKDEVFVVIKRLEDGKLEVRDSKDKIRYFHESDIDYENTKKTTPRSFA